MSNITLRDDVTVKLIDHMGDDASVVRSAKVSTIGSDSVDAEAQAGLINFLMKNRHGTPFEHASMTFLIEAPIFVFREFHRHRVGWSYNEMSGRYTKLRPEFYVPAPDRPLVQEGKPGHYVFVPGTEQQMGRSVFILKSVYETAWDAYEVMLELGIAKEVARACLPVATYSAMYATCNPRSLMHFLSLRTKDESSKFPSYPQHEIELVARGMEYYFERAFSMVYKAYCDNGRVAP